MNKLKSVPTLTLLVRRFTLRHWFGALRQTSLQILILALGIAVFFSIRLANRAAVTSFQNFTGMLNQESDWQIAAPAGLLPVSILGELRAAFGAAPVNIIPVLETTAARPRKNLEEQIGSRETFRLLGLDLVSLADLAPAPNPDHGWFGQSAAGGNGQKFWNILQNPVAVFISAALAEKQGLKIGGHLPLVIDDQIVELEVVGQIPDAPNRPAAPDNLLVMDLPALQHIAHRDGKISRIEFTVPAGPGVEMRRARLHDQLVSLSHDRWQVLTPADRRASAATMTRAFRMNLIILSLVGLLVGLYLIFQSLDGAVVRRREEISILRSLGVTEKIIRQLWLLEAGLLGLLGGIFGALLGWAGAQIAVRFVGRTVNALYFSTTVQSARLDGGEFILALVIAVVAGLLAGWWPARQAAQTLPAQILSRHPETLERKTVWQSTGFAALILAVSFVFVWLPPLRLAGALRLPIGGYVAALGLILGGGILCSRVLQKLAHGLRFTGRYSLAVKMATSHLAHSTSRHRLAVAGLLCAVTMAAGMVILVASFETTMRGWINHTFQADLFITSDGAQSASTQNRIPSKTWKTIAQNPGVSELNPMQTAEIQIGDVSTMLVGVDMEFSRRHPNLTWRQPPLNTDVFDDARNGHLGLASESFGDRFRVKRGDVVTIPTPAGEKRITIAGVFSDYGNERGSLVVSRTNFAKWFGDELATSLILFVKPGTDPENLETELSHEFPGLSILTNRYLRSEILRIFRQTFSVTYALELIGIVVAVIGLGMTLSSILIERRGELTTLRALGWRRDEMARATAVEGALLAICGVGVGTIVSVGLGWILIYVINKQSFGWTLQFEIPLPALAGLGLLVIGSGTAVAYFVGRWGSNLQADREE
jgi:putative ABC transport system permease protein